MGPTIDQVVIYGLSGGRKDGGWILSEMKCGVKTSKRIIRDQNDDTIQRQSTSVQASVCIFLRSHGGVRSSSEWPRLLTVGSTADVTLPQIRMTESLIHQPTVPKICVHLVFSDYKVTVTHAHTQTRTHTDTPRAWQQLTEQGKPIQSNY